jgi:hypothetical protein
MGDGRNRPFVRLMAAVPDWMTPEGTHGVREAQIRKDWEYSRRAIRDARRYVAANRERIDAEWNAHPAPPRTIAGHQADVRGRVGEARWAEMVGEGM